MFPGSGQGKQYPYLLDKILQNHRVARARARKQPWRQLLDYGCGKGGTARWLQSLVKGLDIDLYDPGNAQYKDTPLKTQYDLVYSCDVFEHIEKTDIDGVIEQCQTLAPHNIYIIDMTPAKKHLPDGRNAHILLQDKFEWIEQIERHSHTIQEVLPYSVPDPRFTTRDRVCIHTKR